MAKLRKSDEEKRIFNDICTVFVCLFVFEQNGKPICLICNELVWIKNTASRNKTQWTKWEKKNQKNWKLIIANYFQKAKHWNREEY